MNNDNDILNDLDFDLTPTDTTAPQDQDSDDFGDDLDLNALVEAAETVEQQHATKNNNGISFVPLDDTDPVPPPALPESTPSFHRLDVENLRTWIYPINYPIRGYQLNIVKKAMFHNTLVALPTGLGKTFIAAVVMYNYWRWFPNSKIIFMAPTKPLVTQQIEACFSICGLPQEETTDMSGSISPDKRIGLWRSKRVFFTTPQCVMNDLDSNTCPADRVVCIVVDEAHKSTGNFAYSKVMRKISKKNKQFRVLALTATPGANLDTVQTVISNLHITNIQIRTEDSMDIQEFSYGKNIQSIIVPLSYTQGTSGLLPAVVEEYRTQVFEPILKELSKLPTGVQPEAERNSPFGLQSARTRFQATSGNLNGGLKYSIIQKFLVAEQMSRAYDLLCQHGIAPFIESIENIGRDNEGKKLNKAQMNFQNNNCIKRLIPKLKRDMENPDFIGHPKIDKLVSILLKHFSDLPPGSSSKAMVFSSYRSSVNEICNVLNRHKPMFRASFFVGQADGKNGSKGLKQYEQQEVIQKFKSDEFNVLVATSIGEEGLDIGEVDLIICYDSQSSPIRMLQRMGRTGRKRQGKCVMLMTEAEERKFSQAKTTYANVQRLIAQGAHLNYYSPNPTVIPPNYKPTLCRKSLTVGQYQQKEKKKKRGAGSKLPVDTGMDTEGLMKPNVEEAFIRSFCHSDQEQFSSLSQVIEVYWPRTPMIKTLNKHIPLQTRAKPTFRIGHSRRTHEFVELVQKLEHRILNPDEEVSFTLPKKQTKLFIPSKVNGSNKLIMNKKKKKQYDEYGDPMDTLADFLDPEASVPMNHFDEDMFEPTGYAENGAMDDDFAPSTSKRTIQQFFEPRKKAKISPGSEKPVTKAVRDKGKAKCIDHNEMETSLVSNYSLSEPNLLDVGPSKDKSEEIDEFERFNDFDEFNDIAGIDKSDTPNKSDKSDKSGNQESWSPMLPDSIFDSVSPLPDSYTIPLTTHDSPIAHNSPMAPSSPVAHNIPVDPVPTPSKDEITEINIADLYEQVSDDEFGDDDFPLDDLFIKESEAWQELRSRGFDDKLEAVFPFEKDYQEQIGEFSFIWNDTVPRFSQMALSALDQRQKVAKERTGKFVFMSGFVKYNNESVNSPASEVAASKKEDDEDSFGFDDESFLIHAADLEGNLIKDNVVEDNYRITEGSNHIIEENNRTIKDSNHIIEDSNHVIEDRNHFIEDINKEVKVSRINLKGDDNDLDDSRSDAEGSVGFGDFNFEDDDFAAIFQNNDGDEAPFLKDARVSSASFFEEELAASQAPIKEKSTLDGRRSSSPEPVKLHDELNRSSSPIHNNFLSREDSVLQRDKTIEIFDSDHFASFTSGMNESEEEVPVFRRKKPMIKHSSDEDEDDEVEVDMNRLKKRIRRTIVEDVDEDDDFLSSQRILEYEEEKKRENDLAANPFLDIEAEKSSDDGHTTDEELNSGSSVMMRSFIDYEENSRIEGNENVNMNLIYRRHDDDMPRNSKHWLNRFNSEKWLNPQEDSIMEEEEEEEEEEEDEEGEEEGESIIELSSNISNSNLLLNNNDDEDDFM